MLQWIADHREYLAPNHEVAEDQHLLDAIRQINEAFRDVRLEDGVSLREADVIDSYGNDDDRAAARESDEHDDWRRIPDETMEALPVALGFMDAKGLRFHLPAYMCFTLRRHHDSDSNSVDSAIYSLQSQECKEAVGALLTEQQHKAIGTFLLTCQQLEETLDVDGVVLALPSWPLVGPALPSMIESLDSPMADVRHSSMRALARLGAHARAAVPALTGRLEVDSDRQLAYGAIVEIACQGDSDFSTAAEVLTSFGQDFRWITIHPMGTLEINQLLERNARLNISVNVWDCFGATPLTIAAQHGHTHLVQALLEAGADLRMADLNGHEPISIAQTQEIKNLLSDPRLSRPKGQIRKS